MHELFKNHDAIEYVLREAELLHAPLLSVVFVCGTPLDVMKRFSTTGENGLVATFRKTDKSPELGFEGTFAVPVADYRDQENYDATTQEH